MNQDDRVKVIDEKSPFYGQLGSVRHAHTTGIAVALDAAGPDADWVVFYSESLEVTQAQPENWDETTHPANIGDRIRAREREGIVVLAWDERMQVDEESDVEVIFDGDNHWTCIKRWETEVIG